MVVVVEVVCAGSARPPVGATVNVKVSDTALADAQSPVVGEASGTVLGARSSWLATVEVELDSAAIHRTSQLNVSAHVDVDGDGKRSAGDFITTQSFPVEPAGDGESHAQVSVVKI